MGQNIFKNNIPDNNIFGENIFLRPEEAILEIWQKLVLNQLISVFWEALDLVYNFSLAFAHRGIPATYA